MSNYEVIEWNEDNFPIDKSVDYVKEAYKSKKWAFVSDYVRLYALNKFGGIYFDTDVEVFKTFDDLLGNECFFGFESKDYLTTAVMGASKNFHIINKFLNQYSNKHFIVDDGKRLADSTNVVALTKLMKTFGLKLNGKEQTVADSKIYPQQYFSANNFINIFNRYKKSSYAYHHYNTSWSDNKNKKGLFNNIRHYMLGKARNIFGTGILYNLKHGKK